jgi:hypothetical protein
VAKYWEDIRAAREDLTDYVAHFTNNDISAGKVFLAKDRLKAILRAGFISPTFAPMGHRHNRAPRPTIQRNNPALYLKEQPLSAFLKTPHKQYVLRQFRFGGAHVRFRSWLVDEVPAERYLPFYLATESAYRVVRTSSTLYRPCGCIH